MVSNLAELFFINSAQKRNKVALVFPELHGDKSGFSEKVYTFEDLRTLITKYHSVLRSNNIKKGDQIAILTPLGPELYCFVIAILSVGGVPVFIDPDLGKKNILRLIHRKQIRALFSTQKIFKMRFFIPSLFFKKLFCLDGSGTGLISMEKSSPQYPFEPVTMNANDLALVTFTTGSTGQPKGADRNFGVLLKQHELSRKYWPDHENEIDMPTFPMIALQNMACGVATIIPAVDLRNPASVHPAWIWQQIEKHRITRMSSSPAFLKKLLEWSLQNKKSAPFVQSLIAGGASINKEICEMAAQVFPNSQNFVVYGSTEVEPISFASMNDIIASTNSGYLVGKNLAELKIEIIHFDLPFNSFLDLFFKHGPAHFRAQNIGEIIVTGPHVVKRYLNDEKANYETKLKGPHQEIWHRTGDLGYFDDQGRIVLVGRLKDQMTTRHGFVPNYLIEQKLESLFEIERAAVVQTRDQKIHVCLEQKKSLNHSKDALLEKIHILLKEFRLDSEKNEIHWIDQIPVDHRHNWKINREELKRAMQNGSI